MHSIHDALHHLHRTGSARHNPGAQRRHVEAAELRMIQRGDEHGGNAVNRGGPFVVDRFQRGQRVELRRRQNQRRAGSERRQARHHASETVVQRHRCADAVLRSESKLAAAQFGIVDQIPVREQDTLGRTGGSGRVLNVGNVAGQRRVGVIVHTTGDHRVPGCMAEENPVL